MVGFDTSIARRRHRTLEWVPGVGQLYAAVLTGVRGCKQHGPNKEAPAAIAGLVFVHVKTRIANMGALTFRSLNKREEHKSWSG